MAQSRVSLGPCSSVFAIAVGNRATLSTHMVKIGSVAVLYVSERLPFSLSKRRATAGHAYVEQTGFSANEGAEGEKRRASSRLEVRHVVCIRLLCCRNVRRSRDVRGPSRARFGDSRTNPRSKSCTSRSSLCHECCKRALLCE